MSPFWSKLVVPTTLEKNDLFLKMETIRHSWVKIPGRPGKATQRVCTCPTQGTQSVLPTATCVVLGGRRVSWCQGSGRGKPQSLVAGSEGFPSFQALHTSPNKTKWHLSHSWGTGHLPGASPRVPHVFPEPLNCAQGRYCHIPTAQVKLRRQRWRGMPSLCS